MAFRRFAVSFGLMGAVGGGVLWFYERERVRIEIEKQRARGIGVSSIGGPFTLVNTKGELVSRQSYLGKYSLMYFGFTACPEICPTELRKLHGALDRIPSRQKDQIQPLFVSCDPWRDSIGRVRNYVSKFDDRLEGLTGTPSQVQQICKNFRVYYSKPPAGAETDTEDADYLVDHSIFIYLMDKEGNLLRYFGQDVMEKELAKGIQETIYESEGTNILVRMYDAIVN